MYISFRIIALIALAAATAPLAQAAESTLEARIYRISADGVGEELGSITITGTNDGIVITPRLHGLLPGLHAFHVHEKPSCEPAMQDGKKVAGLAAGGHYNGASSPGPHMEMTMNNGMDKGKPNDHMKMRGDLPELEAAADGTVTKPVTKEGLKITELFNRSLMIHANAEAPTDPNLPKGGGARIACAVLLSPAR